jgi:hypothetical protein
MWLQHERYAMTLYIMDAFLTKLISLHMYVMMFFKERL